MRQVDIFFEQMSIGIRFLKTSSVVNLNRYGNLIRTVFRIGQNN